MGVFKLRTYYSSVPFCNSALEAIIPSTRVHIKTAFHRFKTIISTTAYEMWLLVIVSIVSLPSIVTALEPFDPWALADSECTVAMRTCAFELRATSAMTMFYKQLFRVVATSDGVLRKYDNPNIAFDPSEILTGDGYPKMVIDLS